MGLTPALAMALGQRQAVIKMTRMVMHLLGLEGHCTPKVHMGQQKGQGQGWS